MYDNYLRHVALLDESAASGGEARAEALKALGDEQKAAQFSDQDVKVLRETADDYDRAQKEHRAKLLNAMRGFRELHASVSLGPVDSPELREEVKQIRVNYMEHLKKGLGESSFLKLQSRVHAVYQYAAVQRTIPMNTPSTPSPVSEPPRVSPQ
jgi:hypothetical protein